MRMSWSLSSTDSDIQDILFGDPWNDGSHLYTNNSVITESLSFTNSHLSFLDLTFDWICYFDSSIGPFKRKGFSSTRSRPTKGGSSVWWPSRWSWRGFCRCYNRRFFWGAMFGCIPVQKCRSNDHLIITISSLFWVFAFNCPSLSAVSETRMPTR